MNGSYFVDTNVLIKLLNGDERIATFLSGNHIYISAITEIELLSKSSLTKDEIKKIKSLIEDCIVIDNFSDEIKSFAAKLRREKVVKKTPDAIIAAQQNIIV